MGEIDPLASGGTTPLRVDLQWTPRAEDHVAAFAALRRRGHLTVRIQGVAVAAMALAAAAWFSGHPSVAVSLAAVAVVAQLMVPLLPLLQRFGAHAHVRRHPEDAAPLAVTMVWGQSLSVATQQHSTIYAWSEVTHVEHSAHHVVIFLRDGSIIPVPVSAFAPEIDPKTLRLAVPVAPSESVSVEPPVPLPRGGAKTRA